MHSVSAKISYEKKDKKETGLIIVIMTNPVFYLIHISLLSTAKPPLSSSEESKKISKTKVAKKQSELRFS